MIPVAMKAADSAGREGIEAEVIDLRTLAPMDKETFLASVKKTGRVLVVQEAPKTCGLAAEIAALINESALLNLEAPVMRVTGFDITIPLPRTEDYYYISPERVFAGMKKLMEF